MFIGPIIKSIRIAEDVTLGQLYRNILSNRQAIRFENGENDIKAEGLFAILHRLDMSFTEFIDRYELALDNNQEKQRPVNQVIDRLDAWMDTDITPPEQLAIEQYIRDQPIVTLQQVEKVISLLPALQDQQTDTVISHIVRVLLDHQDHQRARALLASLWGDMTFHWLLNGDRARAEKAVEQWRSATANLPHSFSTTVHIHFIETLLDSLQLPPAMIYKQTDPFITSLRTLGDDDLADAFVDNRRHTLTTFHKHPEWYPVEVGVIARFMMTLELKPDMADYLRQIPGLIDFLHDQKKSLNDYLDNY
ncbi:helix-turn-helix domain-containing protein [Schleiferilactobacillus harbinensis]|uniref:HTH cro/C1-type domain-containing protein n=1 Tax=Schleiferilactobacillus harbinensis TaxID=304207 RepID=A0A5P8M8J2_9LACO|nr:helix-turn-helix transcriptional regulator [Schleiferilactobacillus harbinensis]QFR24535.1 hypothetical protein D1010_14775 [Schleiferilactobacillus harbinensis]